MKAVPFEEAKTQIAKDQPEYETLPALVVSGVPECPVITCWELTKKEALKILWTRRIWLSCWTFGSPLQPLLLTPNKGDVIAGAEELEYDLTAESGLKPCPFCGATGDLLDPEGWVNGDGETGPQCQACGATAESVEKWNSRFQDSKAGGSDDSKKFQPL